MTSLTPVKIPAADKLRVLQRLDQYRKWESLDDKRQCIQCGEVISGREIEVVGGTRGLGPLRLQCPTENCPAIPLDWILPNDSHKPVKREKAASIQIAAPVASSAATSNGKTRFVWWRGFKHMRWGM